MILVPRPHVPYNQQCHDDQETQSPQLVEGLVMLRIPPNTMLIPALLVFVSCSDRQKSAGCKEQSDCPRGTSCRARMCEAANPPVAAIRLPDSSLVSGRRITFDGASSADQNPGGRMVGYFWKVRRCPDTTCDADPAQGTNPTLETIFLCGGSYGIALTVTNSFGLESVPAKSTITVAAGSAANLPPGPALVVDGAVHAITVTADGTSYIGGQFERIGPATGHGVPLDGRTGVLVPSSSPAVNGVVHAAAPDGAGGWYIGGEFTHVGGIPRKNVAHIAPGGAVDPCWDPGCDSPVFALAVNRGLVYVGGDFWRVGGQIRSRVAAIDTAGGLTSWNPAPNGSVHALLVIGDTVYAGGDFHYVGEKNSPGLAAIAPDGTVRDWSFRLDNGADVRALAASGDTLYAGGWFNDFTTDQGTQTRHG